MKHIMGSVLMFSRQAGRRTISPPQCKDGRRNTSSLSVSPCAPYTESHHVAFPNCALCISKWKHTRPEVTRTQVSGTRVSKWERHSVESPTDVNSNPASTCPEISAELSNPLEALGLHFLMCDTRAQIFTLNIKWVGIP